MQEKIVSFNIELNAINVVLDKLVTKQNSGVFDKLCIKCNGLLSKISASIPDIKTSEERMQIIGILRNLRVSALKLADYKEYLIASIDSNIELIENNVVELTQEKPITLKLENKTQKDAA